MTTSLEFRGSPTPTVGIELETTIIDARTRQPLDYGVDLASAVTSLIPVGRACTEISASCLEISSGIGLTVGQSVQDLVDIHRSMEPTLVERSMQLLAMGLHPTITYATSAMNSSPHYEWVKESISWALTDLHTCALHIHVAVPDGDAAVRACNALRGHVPILLAMSASSPLFNGSLTGLASTRASIFTRVPRSGLPPRVENWNEYCALLAAFTKADVMRGPLDTWWDIRFQPALGTIEIRICDAIADVNSIAGLAALIQCLVAMSLHGPTSSLHEAIAMQNRWLATRDGMRAKLIVDDSGSTAWTCDIATNLIASAEPMAGELGCADELGQTYAMASAQAPQHSLRERFAEGGIDDVIDAMTVRWT